MISQLKTIFAKEFYSYFSNISAYFAVGVYVILTLASAFYFGDFFKIDNSNLISLFGPQPEILSLLIPAICMPLWSEEYRSGTIEFLLTQPVEYRVILFYNAFSDIADIYNHSHIYRSKSRHGHVRIFWYFAYNFSICGTLQSNVLIVITPVDSLSCRIFGYTCAYVLQI